MFFAVCEFVFRSFSFFRFFLFSIFAVFRFSKNRNFSFSQFFVFAKFRKMKNIFPKKVFRATPVPEADNEETCRKCLRATGPLETFQAVEDSIYCHKSIRIANDGGFSMVLF